MSHADCDHPRTPAGRAACRKAGNTGTAKIRVVQRTKGDGGVVKATQKAMADAGVSGTPKRRRSAVSVDLKRPGTRLRGNHDLADVPRVFMRAINAAWENDWEVIVGETFDHTSRRIIVRAEHGDINLAWSSANPNGLQRVAFRPAGTSVTSVVSTLNGALRLAMGEDE
jgi:hypothetical protein